MVFHGEDKANTEYLGQEYLGQTGWSCLLGVVDSDSLAGLGHGYKRARVGALQCDVRAGTELPISQGTFALTSLHL